MAAPGLIVAAPASGSGKTVFTLALLRALARRGIRLASAKVGPDYIDPAFHTAASGTPCRNLDGWAMRPAALAQAVATLSQDWDLVVCEGVMGLFDGADVIEGPNGSTADIAALTGWPVILLVDLRRQAASAAAVIQGFRRHRPDVAITGVVFNQVAGGAHRDMVERACHRACPDLPLLGWLPRDPALVLPERHLGLVQAGETTDLEDRLDRAAQLVARHVDLDRLIALAQPTRLVPSAVAVTPLATPGRRVAIARDEAFAFVYPALLDGWRRQGAELCFFSPLADEAPDSRADAVYLPGGYPELHAGRLAAAARFRAGMEGCRAREAWIYGECGGYMTLGDGLEDADGARHAMLGFLPLATSFAKRRLHLGYRRCRLTVTTPFGPAGADFRAHEFHYASTLSADGASLFETGDAQGRDLPPAGLVHGRVIGSFLHLIDRV